MSKGDIILLCMVGGWVATMLVMYGVALYKEGIKELEERDGRPTRMMKAHREDGK